MSDFYEKIYKEAANLNDKNLGAIIKTYGTVYSDVAKTLKKNLSYTNNPMFSKVTTYSLNKYIESKFAELVRDLKVVAPKGIESAMEIAYAEALLSKHIKDDIRSIKLDDLLKDVPRVYKSGQVVTELKAITMKDLLQVTNNTEYAVKKLVRDSFTKHLQIDAMKSRGQKELANKLIAELTGKGLDKEIYSNMTGIVDKAGRRWNVSNYVDMATKTKFHQAHVAGVQQFVKDYDGKGDLARIPKNQLTDDSCKNFEGMIISMTGKTKGYRTYAELKATGSVFHCRCRHNPKPYWDEESIPKTTMQTHLRVSKHATNLL